MQPDPPSTATTENKTARWQLAAAVLAAVTAAIGVIAGIQTAGKSDATSQKNDLSVSLSAADNAKASLQTSVAGLQSSNAALQSDNASLQAQLSATPTPTDSSTSGGTIAASSNPVDLLDSSNSYITNAGWQLDSNITIAKGGTTSFGALGYGPPQRTHPQQLNLDLKGDFGKVDAVVGVFDRSPPECAVEVQVLVDNVSRYHKTLRWGETGQLHLTVTGASLLQFVALKTPIVASTGQVCSAAVGKVFAHS
jgi:hypothetical protein